jgi:hypothetical protein
VSPRRAQYVYSLPDVFVPASSPGTTALSGAQPLTAIDAEPGRARLTLRLAQAADILDMPLLDH